MKRVTLLAAAFALSAACGAENRTSIEILGRAVATDLKACSYMGSGQTFVIGNDDYDLALGGPYSLALTVQNNLVDPKTLNASAVTDSNAWSVQAVRVRVNPSDYVGQFKPSPALAGITGQAVLPVATSPVVKPAGGLASIYLSSLLSDGVLTAIQGVGAGGQIVLGITLEGHTGDGARLDSGELIFPLGIVSGVKTACASLVCPSGTNKLCDCDGQTAAGFCQ